MYTENVAKLIGVLVESRTGDWNWYQNMDNRYLTIHIDMRQDGKCEIRNRHGKVITIEDLRYQVGDE